MAMAQAASAMDNLQTLGVPTDRGVNFQDPVTQSAREIVWLDTMLLYVIAAICAFVVALLAWVVIRYNSRSNPKPATFSHNQPLEVVWTVIPVIILVVIGIFSLPVLLRQMNIPKADVTIKATGNQWYWTYEYPDHEIEFDSFMLPREELAENGYSDDEYLLATDTAIVIPVNKTVVVQVTASDVIHAWTVPAFGVKQDGVPGRLAELWFKAEREGVYFGQCSELCGKDHTYMPITVKVVSQRDYDAWLREAIREYAGEFAPVQIAMK